MCDSFILFILDNWDKYHMLFDYESTKYMVDQDEFKVKYKGSLQNWCCRLFKYQDRYFIVEGGNGFYNAPYETTNRKLSNCKYIYTDKKYQVKEKYVQLSFF